MIRLWKTRITGISEAAANPHLASARGTPSAATRADGAACGAPPARIKERGSGKLSAPFGRVFKRINRGMDNRFNTIAGWVLGGAIVLLGATLVTGELFHAERPETMGYPIAGVVEEGAGAAEAEQPIAFYLATADVGRGEAQFRKCTSCHTINQGGANGLGPNLYGVMGAGVAQHAPGFNYSEPLRSRGGTWDWETMSAWIKSPRAFAEGTRMSFPGLSDPQARADLLLYLNSQGSSLPVPPPPAAAAPAGNEAAGNGAAGNEVAPGNPPGTSAAEAAAQPQNRSEGQTKGPAATDTSGRAAQERGN